MYVCWLLFSGVINDDDDDRATIISSYSAETVLWTERSSNHQKTSSYRRNSVPHNDYS